jgi:hypothetical protein
VIDEHARHVPPARLRPFVSGYTGYRQEGVAPVRHRGLPSPELTFIVTLDDPLAIDAHPDPGQPAGSYDTLLGGLHTSPALVSHQGRWSGVQLGLTPLGARMLLGLPAASVANWDAEATDVIGGFAAQLRELVVEQPTWGGRFAVIDQLLERRAAELEADRRATVRPEVGYAWRRLRETRGGAGAADRPGGDGHRDQLRPAGGRVRLLRPGAPGPRVPRAGRLPAVGVAGRGVPIRPSLAR